MKKETIKEKAMPAKRKTAAAKVSVARTTRKKAASQPAKRKVAPKKTGGSKMKDTLRKNLALLLIIIVASSTGFVLLQKCDDTGRIIDEISAYISDILLRKPEVSNKQVSDFQKADPCKERAYSGEVKVSAWYEKTDTGYLMHISEKDLAKLPNFEDSENFRSKNSSLKLVDATKELETKLKKATEKKPVDITLKGYGIACEGNPLASIETGEFIFNKI